MALFILLYYDANKWITFYSFYFNELFVGVFSYLHITVMVSVELQLSYFNW